jgi:hypothetical protein
LPPPGEQLGGGGGRSARWAGCTPGAILESPRCAFLTVVEGRVGPTRKEVLAEWGDWLNREWEWSWFVTLTFDVKRLPAVGTRTVVGWSASSRAWDQWLERLIDSSGLWEPRSVGAIPRDAWWIRGREPNPWRQGTHFHALIGGLPPSASRRDAWSDWFGRHGLARILPYEPSLGAAHYLTKYVVKELGDVVFSPNLQLHRRAA